MLSSLGGALEYFKGYCDVSSGYNDVLCNKSQAALYLSSNQRVHAAAQTERQRRYNSFHIHTLIN